MASSSTEICNLALGHLGVSKRIENLETDSSQAATVCRVFYDSSVEEVLRDFDWPFARTTASLGLVASDPTTEWSYSYRYPSDCILLLRIFSGTRNDTRQSRIPYKIMYDSAGKLIYSDEQSPVVEYIKNITETDQFEVDFTVALSYLIASYIAPSLMSGDRFGLGEKAANKYQERLAKAKAKAVNEEQPEEMPESEFIRARA